MVELKASGGAFAARRFDGSVVTWGIGGHGGASSRVQAGDRDGGHEAMDRRIRTKQIISGH